MSTDSTTDYFDEWDVSEEELNSVLNANNSLCGMVKGYLAEEKLRQLYFEDHPRITRILNPDCHDRDAKGDWHVYYDGTPVSVEVKSLQSNSVKHLGDKDDDVKARAKFQCDASDSRDVPLPNGNTVRTTSLLAGEFDILAVNLFALTGEWDFAFALNEDLPRSQSRKLDEEDSQHLLKGTMMLNIPLDEPFTDDPYELLDTVSNARED